VGELSPHPHVPTALARPAPRCPRAHRDCVCCVTTQHASPLCSFRRTPLVCVCVCVCARGQRVRAHARARTHTHTPPLTHFVIVRLDTLLDAHRRAPPCAWPVMRVTHTTTTTTRCACLHAHPHHHHHRVCALCQRHNVRNPRCAQDGRTRVRLAEKGAQGEALSHTHSFASNVSHDRSHVSARPSRTITFAPGRCPHARQTAFPPLS
jgi:hypothetical protein